LKAGRIPTVLSEIQKREDSQFKSFAEMEKVISALANVDALKVFYAAGEGIESSTEAIKELGLTQKRYYTHLRSLMEAGLIEKREEAYQQTTLGKICYKLGEAFESALSHRDRLELMDKLKRSKSISLMEKEEIVHAILKDNFSGFADLLNGGMGSVGIVQTLEDIKVGVRRLIEKAEKNMYLATRYTDPSVTETILNCLDRGVKMYLLDGDKKNLSQKFQLIRLIISHPSMVKLFYQIFRSSNVYTGYTDNLPYSFIVVDERYVGIEIPKPQSDEFFLGLFFENELLARKLIEVFNLLTMKAIEDPKKEFSEKIYAQLPKET